MIFVDAFVCNFVGAFVRVFVGAFVCVFARWVGPSAFLNRFFDRPRDQAVWSEGGRWERCSPRGCCKLSDCDGLAQAIPS